MSFVHATNGRVLFNETHQSGQIVGYTLTHQRKYAETATLLDSGERYIPGLASGKVTLKGLFDSSATLKGEIEAGIGVDDSVLITAYPDGATVGRPAFIAVCDPEDYQVNADLKDAVKIEFTGMPGDGVDWGVSLHDLAAETSSSNSTGVDGTAATTNGGVASLHVTAYSGFTSVAVKLQDSANNSTWADLSGAAFTSVTALTSQRLALSGTVRQYTRAVWTVTGTGSITFTVALARR